MASNSRPFDTSPSWLKAKYIEQKMDLLPPVWRDKSDAIKAMESEACIANFLQTEFDLQPIEKILKYLWLAGLLIPPRSLHHQLATGREIVTCERLNMHLVWSGKIFLKPLPQYLLCADFWTDYLAKPAENPEAAGTQPSSSAEAGRHSEVVSCARGFLFSYCCLIIKPVDFHLAQDAGLLPKELTWEEWLPLAKETVQHHRYQDVHERFLFGELRLSRLNSICRWTMQAPFRGYSSIGGYSSYDEIISENFALMASIFAFVAIVLTALQLGLTTNELKENSSFHRASYGFAILSILAPIILSVLIVAVVLVRVVVNLVYTVEQDKRRLCTMGLGENAIKNKAESLAARDRKEAEKKKKKKNIADTTPKELLPV